jgi:internalin A
MILSAVMIPRSLLALVLAAAFTVVGCDNSPKHDATAKPKPSATAPLPTPEPTAAKPKPKPKPKKRTLADCPKGNKVEFVDDAVEKEVRRKLSKDKGDITIADLGKVRSLNLSQAHLDQLDPCVFTHLKNLHELFLGPSQVLDDLSPIAGLKHLESLRASLTQISDIKPLEGLVHMDRLDLGHTQVRDLKPLAKLEAITELQLDNTPVEDLTPLSKLKKLQRLSLKNTRVKDFSPLKDLKSLEFIYVAGTPATDISPLLPLKKDGLKIIDR